MEVDESPEAPTDSSASIDVDDKQSPGSGEVAAVEATAAEEVPAAAATNDAAAAATNDAAAADASKIAMELDDVSGKPSDPNDSEVEMTDADQPVSDTIPLNNDDVAIPSSSVENKENLVGVTKEETVNIEVDEPSSVSVQETTEDTSSVKVVDDVSESGDMMQSSQLSTSPSDPSKSATVSLVPQGTGSPKIPSVSLTYRAPGASRVIDKEMKPTVIPTPLLIPLGPSTTPVQMPIAPGDNVFKLLTYSKSISSALASQLPREREKRKHSSGCANMNCSHSEDELVIAPNYAILFFHFNTALKKVFKICTACLGDAEKYMVKTKRAALNGDCVLTFKTEPQGLDGDIIEVAGDDDDDSADVLIVERLEKELLDLDLTCQFDDVINNILGNIDVKAQMEKCDKALQQETSFLERDLVSLNAKLAFAEKQMIEGRKMYEKMAGYHTPVPMILEELDIDTDGNITRTPGKNQHIGKMALRLKDSSKAMQERQNVDARGNSLQNKVKDEKKFSKENRIKDEEGEIFELKNSKPVGAVRTTLAPTPSSIPRVMPTVGSIVFAVNRTLLHFWLKAEIIEVINAGSQKITEFVVRFDAKRGKRDPNFQLTKQVTSRQIAYNLPCPFVLPVGARIIAKFRDELKTEPAGDGQFYAGIVAEPPKNTNNLRYLVFFDDGYAQYVPHHEVLMVYESSKEVWSDVHPDSSDFIRNYVQKFPERPMVRLSIGQIVTTEWNGKWWVARVVELDCSLVKMKFENDGRFEWIYRGSTRLSPLFEKQNRQKTHSVARRHVSFPQNRKQPLIEYTYGDDDMKKNKPVARKSTAQPQHVERSPPSAMRIAQYDYGEFEGSIIKKQVPASAPKTREYIPHRCNSSCVYEYNEDDKELRKINPLSIPLFLGWTRQDIKENGKGTRRTIHYKAPCGKRLKDYDELYDFLAETRCNIQIDHFCYDLAVDCMNEFRHAKQHSFLPDLTYGKESTPVQVVNAFDFEYPPYVEYSSSRIPGEGVELNTDDEFLVGCNCVDDCRDKSKCSCWQLTLSGISFTKLNDEEEYKEYPLRGYENRRLNGHVISGVYECNPMCKCRKTCCNRVVQNGLKVPLQVFKTAAKGWGIRPLYDIPEGSFICIYAGQVLTEQGANEDGKQFGDEYLAELDYIESNEQIKQGYESDVTDIEEEDVQERSRKRKAKDISDEVDNHAADTTYRGAKVGASERTIATRNKNGRGSTSQNSSSDPDEDEGVHMRSRFNAESTALSKTESVERRPLRELFAEDEQCYIMDAKTVGNIGRYLNHSCSPNVFVQNVFVDTHDLRFPWVAFFSSTHIRAGSELTWDYNYDIGSVPDKVMYCYCGSPECRGRLL